MSAPQDPAYGQQQQAPAPAAAASTNIIINQPAPAAAPQQVEREWNSGRFACFDDIGSCVIVWFCAPFYQCILSDRMGEGCLMPLCVPHALPALRLKLRMQENISGSILKDCCATEFCGPCTMCQLKRELDYVDQRK